MSPVWLAKLAASMICSRHEASVFPSCIEARCPAGTLIVTACSTPQTRISEHPDLYQTLSSRDQALVNQGQIRIGMSRTAVWLAWGTTDRKIIGNMGGGPTETWIYTYASYPYYPYYAPWDIYFGAPLYDPFCYSWFPQSIPYPGKVVTFANGRVASFQYVKSP